jgi:protein ImuA
MSARAKGDGRVLGALRARVAAIETAGPRPGRVLPLGDPRVDACLSGGGLPLGRWHELTGDGLEAEDPAAVTGFAVRLAAALANGGTEGRESRPGETVWVFRRDDLYAPGLVGAGLDPARLLFVAVRKDEEVLAAVEDALRTAGVAAVAGEVETLDLTAGRRLQLACEKTGATGLILRRRHALRAGRGATERVEASAAATRWRIGPSPSQPEQARFSGLGPPRWRVELARSRGGRTGGWILEAGDGPHALRVVAELGDHELQETPARRVARG